MASLAYGSTEIVRDGNILTYVVSGVAQGSCIVDGVVDGTVGLSLAFGERMVHLSAGEARALFDVVDVVASTVSAEAEAAPAKRTRRR